MKAGRHRRVADIMRLRVDSEFSGRNGSAVVVCGVTGDMCGWWDRSTDNDQRE